MRHRWVSYAGGLVSVLAVVWFCSELFSRNILLFPAGYASLPATLHAVVVYSIQGPLLGWCWHLILKGAGQAELSFFRSLSIVCVTQIAKYVPGNIAHHVGRVVLAKRNGIGMNATLFSMFMETLWLITVAAMIALVALWFVGGRLFNKIPQAPEWWVLAGLAAGAILVLLIGHRLFERATRWWAERTGVEIRSIKMPPLRTFWSVGLLYALNFLILGLVLQIIATQVFDARGGDILMLSGVFAVAWIVGFVTPGAPAGLGIREVILMAALTPVYDNETAVGIAAVLRVVTVLGDGVAFLIGLALERWAGLSLNST